MSLTSNTQRDVPVTSTGRAAGPQRARARVRRAGLVVVALLGTGVLAAACGGGSSTTGPAGAHSGSNASLDHRALAYVTCMRTHGEPNMPDPTNQGDGHVNININASSGIDPTSPRFTAASRACQHLVPHGGAAAGKANHHPGTTG